MADDSLTTNGRKVSAFSMADIVELLGSDGPSRGRVIATRDGGKWISVLWLERAGYRSSSEKDSESPAG